MSWWVEYSIPVIGQNQTETVVQAATRPSGNNISVATGPYATQQEAQNTISGLHTSGSVPPLPSIPAFTGLAAIGDFFGRLTEPNTWLRIGEGLLGIILIAVALGKLSGLEDTAKTAAAAAVKYVK